MYQMLFKSRWIAILFGIVTLASVISFVGSGNKDGAVDRVTGALEAQREVMREFGANGFAAHDKEEEEPATAFWPEDDLVDDASGFDPTPEAQRPQPQATGVPTVAADGKTYIVVKNGIAPD